MTNCNKNLKFMTSFIYLMYRMVIRTVIHCGNFTELIRKQGESLVSDVSA